MRYFATMVLTLRSDALLSRARVCARKVTYSNPRARVKRPADPHPLPGVETGRGNGGSLHGLVRARICDIKCRPVEGWRLWRRQI